MPHEGKLPITHRILVIDDNPAIHDDFRRILAPRAAAQNTVTQTEALLFGDAPPIREERPCWDLECALQGAAGVDMAIAALRGDRPYSLAFIDMLMPPGWDGLRTIEELWRIDTDVQVVICSAHSDYDWIEVQQRLGHCDRLLILKKPFEPIEILQCASALTCKWQNARALKRHVEHLEQVINERTHGLEAANRQLRYLASHDPLTGLPNRVLLDDRLSQAIAHAQRTPHEFAVMLVDLDRFKLINDSLGHRVGDDLLKEVARRLSGAIRTTDTLARLGGDEFVVVTSPADNRTDVEHIAARMLAALQPSVQLLGVDVHTHASMGIAFYPQDATTSQSLLAHADAAMYCAKERGGNNVQHYAPGMNAENSNRVKLESDLHAALDLGQFELHYQPKADTITDEVNSAEALIRWRHPERGLLLPDQFIPIADECGLLVRIGEWVLHEACRQAKEWQRQGLRPIRVAVNLAPSQFRLSDLAGKIREALNAADLDPSFLEVELTESAVMSQAEESAEILETLSRMGVLVSVDDFGTGYSSMSYLRRFPIDKLKIDRSFIHDLTTRPDDVSIVRAIVSLAHSLRLKVVAEGVETREQLELLKSLGCDHYQGFHYSPALPQQEFADLIRSRTAAEPSRLAQDTGRTYSKLAVLKQ